MNTAGTLHSSFLSAQISSEGQDRPLSVVAFDELPADDLALHQVIDGTLHMAPLPTIAHQRIASRLLIVLGAYLADNPLGEVFTSNTKVVLDERTCIGPDLVFLARERFGLLRHDGIHGPPDLVVEILSSKPDLDRVVKFAKCQQAGVAHYWLLDPEARTAETFELREGAYAMVARIGSGDRLETALFPGLIIESDHLWRP